ncbi:MAG: phage tail tape measure protein [Prevotella sp.]|nr:phage tail tape measure protein [Prevotella sp.]MDY5289811.1 phage tail tape measure protein [Prevotella sp.]
MAQNFEVNYDIRVFSENAVKAINDFSAATKQLTDAMAPFRKLNTSVSNLNEKLVKLNSKTFSVKIETGNAEHNIDRLLGKLRQMETIAKRTGLNVGSVAAASGVGGTAKGSSASSKSSSSSSRSSKSASSRASGGKAIPISNSKIARNLPNNLGYKLLGPTQLDVGGIMAIDMLKGMGIAYGIAGIGNLISSSVKDFAEYNNIMQTAKNILGSHDKRSDFADRFAAMEKQVRNVGVETKFTAPQVADAAKFLSMAGFDVDAINKSIKPIADIALVGDTDLGETADVVTNIMTGYNISPDKVRNAADIMTMTFTKSNTTLMEIAEAYKYSASLLSAGNMPFEEATAAMGILGNAGIKGSQAGTTMRTIMANIVNPTKKQLAAWNRIGVSRTDKNGNMRDVVDIFEDLNKKDLSLSDYYQIFHKTAAQGAVSLADNVETWNDIIKANFMSEGLAKELADEKKNTIQGLWAQLTSMFTEDGIEAFEEIQQPIKNFLIKITDWLKTDDAKNFIKQTAKDLMDFAHMIYDVTKKMLGFYESFRPLIKTFVEFQLKMWPMLTTMRLFRAGLLGFASIVKLSGTISTLTGKIFALGSAMRSVGVGAWMKNFASSGFGLRTYWQDAFTKGTLSNRQVTPEVLARYHRIYGNTKSQVGAGAAGAGIGAVLGGAIDGWGGYEIGKAVSGGSDTGGMIGGAVGGLAGFAALAAGGPVGWGIAGALALGGIAAAFYNANAASEEARKSLEAYTNSLSNNGLLSEDHFSMTERYLNLVYNKELDIKNVIEERINLRNQELGLTSGKNTDSADWSGKVFDSMLNKFDGVDKFYRSSDMARSAIETVNRVANTVFKANGGKFDHPNGKVFYNAPDDNIYWVDARGNTNKIVNPGGWNDVNDVVAAMSSLYLEGLNGSKGASVIQSMENRMRAAMMTGNYRDFIDIKNSWQKNYGTLRYTTNTRPDLFSYGINDVKAWTPEDKVASYPYQQGLYDRMNALYGENSQRWKDIDAYWNASKNNKLTEDIVVKYISAVDSSLGALLVNYTSKSFDDWIKGLGYLNGTFQSKTQAEYAKTGLEDLLKVINALGTPAQDATTNLFKLAVQLNGIANGFLWNAENGHGSFDYPIGGLKVGDTKTVDGTTYKYDGKMWNPMNSMIMRPVDNNTMQGMVNRQKKVGSAATGGRNGRVSSITPGTHNGKVGASQADYKQHYNNKTAAPKQVIVKIENLMNVKSIDLSKKDNQEVIDNVKAQLTQALVDVVHDFDDTWNG